MDWVEHAKFKYEFTILMDNENKNNFHVLKNFCNTRGLTFLESEPFHIEGCIDSGIERLKYLNQKYDIVEMYSWASAATNNETLEFAKRLSVPVILFSPFSQPIETLPDPEKYFEVNPSFQQVLCSSHAVFLLSSEEKKLKAFSHLFENNKMHVIYGGINGEKFKYKEGIEKKQQILCAFDFREKRKRLDLIFEAFARLVDSMPEVTLVLAGKGSAEVDIPYELNKFNIIKLGYISDEYLLELYSESSLFLSLSDYEAFCLPIAEALSTGCPVLINDNAIMRDVFSHLPGVSLVQNHDSRRVAEMAEKILKSKQENKKIALAAHNKFEFKVVYNKKLKIIDDLVNTNCKQIDFTDLRVLHFTPSYYSSDSIIGGGEKFVNYMLKALDVSKAYKAKADVLAIGSVYGKYDYIKSSKLIVCPLLKNLHNISKLKYILDDYDIIIVHQCLSDEGLFIASLARLLGKLIFGIDHGGGEAHYLSNEKDFLSIYNLLIAQSEYARISFLDYKVNYSVLKGPFDDLYYRLPFKLFPSNKNILSIGRILPHKGFEDIIDAMPIDANLTIIGSIHDTNYYDYLKTLASNLSKNVSFETNADDFVVRDYIYRADLVVHASKHQDIYGRTYAKPELLGLVPLESLGCGTPILVSEAGALSELSECLGCMTFDSVEDLKQKIEFALINLTTQKKRRQMSDDVSRKYGLFQYATHFDNLLKEFTKVVSD